MGMVTLTPAAIPVTSFALEAAALAAALVLYAVYEIGTNLRGFSKKEGAADQSGVLKQMVLPLVIAAFLGSSSLWSYAEGLADTSLQNTARAWLIPAAVVFGLLAFLGWSSHVWMAFSKKEYSWTRALGLVLLHTIMEQGSWDRSEFKIRAKVT